MTAEVETSSSPSVAAVPSARRSIPVALRETPMVVLDLETFFDRDYSLRKMSVVEYVNDRRFHVHGLAMRDATGYATFRTDIDEALDELRQRHGERLERASVVMHN